MSRTRRKNEHLVEWMLRKYGWSYGSHHTKPPPSQHGSSFKIFSSFILAAKWLVRHSSTSPKKTRRPFALFPVWFFSLKLILSVFVQEENHSPHPRLPLLPGKPRGLWPPNIRVHPRYVHSFFEFTRTYQLVQCTAVLGSYPEIFLFLDPCYFTRLLY